MDIRSFFKSSTGEGGKGPSAVGKNGKGGAPKAGAKKSPSKRSSTKVSHNTGASKMTWASGTVAHYVSMIPSLVGELSLTRCDSLNVTVATLVDGRAVSPDLQL